MARLSRRVGGVPRARGSPSCAVVTGVPGQPGARAWSRLMAWAVCPRAGVGAPAPTADLNGPPAAHTGDAFGGIVKTCGLACHDEVARSVAGRGRSCRSDQEPSLTIRSVAGTQPVTNGWRDCPGMRRTTTALPLGILA